MNLMESTIRFAFPALGVGVRWLKEELVARGVSVRITDACLRELVAEADAVVRRQSAEGRVAADEPYTTQLRKQLAAHAEFVRAWTQSDERIDADGRVDARLVSIARKYALPRAWRLSEPVAAEARHPTPTYLYWASAT
jgi:hypothetical protein